MEASELLAKLVEALENLGVEVCFETFSEEDFCRVGGACRIAGRPVVLVDRRLGIAEKTGLLAKTLRGYDLEGVYLPPAVRRAVYEEEHRS